MLSTVIFLVIILSLLILLGISVFYLYRFATYVIAIEDSLNEAIRIHKEVTELFVAVTESPVYFDSLEIRKLYDELMNKLKICAISTQRVVDVFTNLSKKRYILEPTVVDSTELQQNQLS